MNITLFEELLYEEEGPALDFKVQQYRFAKADEVEKSELIKDIIGFANAWRRGANSFILIGVKEVRGGRSEVEGIDPSEHLDDHSLQQFVNSLTNRPIQLRYEAFGYDNKQVGIISIDEQPRPFYLKKNYGKLKKDLVYVRRGSSTNPNQPASPDEIAEMGRANPVDEARLEIHFADISRNVRLGSDLSLQGEFCEFPEKIPDYREKRQGPDNALARIVDISNRKRINEDFFRELAEFEFTKRLYRPIRLSVKNLGHQAARNVRVEIKMDLSSKIQAIGASDFPRAPRKRKSEIDFSSIPFTPRTIHVTPGTIDVTNQDGNSNIAIDCLDMQPGRTIFSDEFLIGIGESGSIQIDGLIYSDMSKPQKFSLRFNADIKQTSVDLKQLFAIEEPEDAY